MAAISFRQSFLGKSGVAGALRRCYTLLDYQGSRVFTVTTVYVTRATTWTRHHLKLRSVATTSGGLGPLSLGASRASANGQEIALRQLCRWSLLRWSNEQGLARGWVARDRRCCMSVNQKGHRLDAA